jgi:hypothetical protein
MVLRSVLRWLRIADRAYPGDAPALTIKPRHA